MKECYLIYTCDEWKSTSSMDLEYVIEDVNDIFVALRKMVEEDKIEVNPFPEDKNAACNYLYTYQNNRNKMFNGTVDLCDLDSRVTYASIQKFEVGVQ